MRAVRYSAAEQFGVEEVELGTLPDGYVRLRVLASGVCGTDAHIHREVFGVGDNGPFVICPSSLMQTGRAVWLSATEVGRD